MQEQLKKLEEEFNQDCCSISSEEDIQELKVKYLGRKSLLSSLFSQIPNLSNEEKGLWGMNLNKFKLRIASIIEEKARKLKAKDSDFDLTFPSAKVDTGSVHVLSSVNQAICSIFEGLGFVTLEGKEIEDEWHNFTALNFPDDHPSRDSFDTFYLDIQQDKDKGKSLLRCHTSPSQIRIMQQYKPPMAVISPGRVYRPDEVDATHSFMFHQIEGFAVSQNISFADLKGVLLRFAQEFFSPDVNLRFRPHFFPFTEPSAEVDLSCIICGQKKEKEKKCSICKDKGWLEILGCGMIHPNVLSACGIDPKKYKGFAFGMGVERIAMLKYRINDIRLFYENDVRFLNQF
ncbi:MAG: phenylalanine--tRNA ligase subunit alpha [Candidatus Omnitrophica bacterium]|nr:phenylalanine--tRNA ligase subunit alpha [Candidatus Omnitrophota bacterium]